MSISSSHLVSNGHSWARNFIERLPGILEMIVGHIKRECVVGELLS